MMLKAYRDAQFQFVKARGFAAFKADSKYVMAVTPDGREWLLDEGTTLKAIEAVLPDLVRLNRSVLVKRCHVIELIRVRLGGSIAIRVKTTVGMFGLARRSCVKTIDEIIEHNHGGDSAHVYPLESPELATTTMR